MNKLFVLSGIKESDGSFLELRKNALLADTYSDSRYVVEIISGSVSVQCQIPDEKRVLISKLDPGALFGISNLFLENDLKTVLECIADAKLFLVPKSLVKQRLAESNEAMEYYCTLMNKKLQFLIERIENISLPRARSKVAFALLFGHFDKTKRKEDIASYLAISKASLFRELTYFLEMGLITKNGRKIKIVNRDALDAYLSESE